MSKGVDIADRLVRFSVRIIRLAHSLHNSTVNKHISNQLLRSGTSPGANYEEARGAESTGDFIHKLKVVLKELRESIYWLKVIEQAKIIPSDKLRDILQEAEELSNIIGRSIITAQKNQRLK
ncbi:MAG: four helix bundle protein [Deltaproteobacteria bacterium]|nr:four helix bundle protein [Deltaproteobacteria bacterium]